MSCCARSATARTSRAVEGDAPVPPNLNPPEAIRELVARRVSRLPEDVIYLLQAAAVAGCRVRSRPSWPKRPSSHRTAASTPSTGPRSPACCDGSGAQEHDRYAFSHALVRDAIYGELLRGRRVRYHHKIAVATEHAHGDALDAYVNELAHHFYMGAALADADKAVRYCLAAGEQALRLLAFEEAVGHFTRGLELAEHYGPRDPLARCDALLALAEAQNRSGDDACRRTPTSSRRLSLARGLGDPERLATAAVRAGPLSYLGIVEASEPAGAAARGSPGDAPRAGLALARHGDGAARSGHDLQLRHRRIRTCSSGRSPSTGPRWRWRDASGTATRWATPSTPRMHALWGIAPASERMAIGTELGEIAEDIGDELLALHGHMWRIRELVAQGDVEAVKVETARFEARETGPVHPLDAAFGFNVGAMMALLAGDFETAERLGRTALDVVRGLQRAWPATLLRGTDAVDVVATGRAGPAAAPAPRRDRPGAAGVSGRQRGAGTGRCRGERDGDGAEVSGRAQRDRLGAASADQSEGRDPCDGRRGLRHDRPAGPPLRPEHLRSPAALRRHGRGDPRARSSVPRSGRPLPRPARRRGWATWRSRRSTSRRPCAWPGAWIPRPSWRRPRRTWPGRCGNGAGWARRSASRCCCAAPRSPRRRMGLHRVARLAAEPG